MKAQPEQTGSHSTDPEAAADRLRTLSILAEALESAPDAICLSTPQGRHYYQNRAFTDLFGVVGENPPATLYCDGEVGRKVFTTIMAGGTWTGEVAMYARDRRILNVRVRAYASADERGAITALVCLHTDITDRKRADEAIGETEERLRAMSDNLPGGLVYQVDTGRDGTERRFTYISNGVQELHEVSAAAVLGDAMRIYSQVNEEDRRLVTEREAQATKTLTPFSVEVRVTLPSGKMRWRIFASAPRRLPDGRLIWDGVELDITDRKTVEQRARSTIASSPVGMHFYRLEPDNQLVFIGANPAADRLLGVENAQFVGKTIEAAFPPLAATEIPDRYRRVAATGEKWEADEIVYEHSQIKGAYSVIAFQIEPRHMAAMFFDVTDRKLAEETQRRIGILEGLGTVAGGIAHDFNNLLTGVFGHIELAQVELPPDHPAMASLRAAHQALDTARRLTARLLTFAKGGSPVLEAVDLRQGIADTVRFHLAGSNVAVQFDIAEDLWPAKADKGQISEVIANLTLNAKEAMPNGGTLHVQARNVSGGGEAAAPAPPHGDCVRLTFRDEGIGIPAGMIGKIFDPYFTTKKAGSGLGLAVVHGIVSKHHGHVAVDSLPDVGSTFTVLLPADTANRLRPKAGRSPTPEAPRRTSGRVLLMDDDEVIRGTTSCMLERLGHTVETVRDGREAVARYAAAMRSGKPFDATIMDLTIPGGIGGKEAIVELLALDPAARVIVASGYSSDPVLSEFAGHGFCGRLAKPFNLQELDEAVSLAIKQS